MFIYFFLSRADDARRHELVAGVEVITTTTHSCNDVYASYCYFFFFGMPGSIELVMA